MNSTSFVGNLGQDPVLRESTNGNKRATFSVAVSEGERGTDTEKTHWIPVTAFGTLGENVVESLKSGMRVIVTGRFDSYPREVQINGEDKSLTMLSFIATAVGPDLRWAKAKVEKVASGNGASNGGTAKAAPAKAAAAPAATGGDDDDDF